MKKKGVIVTAFFGFILLSSTILLTLPGIDPMLDSPEITITGTPADNYIDQQRPQFCGSSNAKSTAYIQEFSIPTPCTNPLAIITDYDGNVWFAETNTGNLAKFDPNTEIFTEYDNPLWLPGGRSMMWGIDYAPDGSLWYTDEGFDSIWKFSTFDNTYEQFSYPSEGNSLPQKLRIDGSQIIINDFTGNKLTFSDPNQSMGNADYLSIPSPVGNSVTSDFTLDADDNIWYTNWLFQQGGVLVKFDQNEYFNSITNSEEEEVGEGEEEVESLGPSDFIQVYGLPASILTSNGIVAGSDGTIWLSDTSSSSFYNFNPLSARFTQYVTSDPLPSTYGNQTGLVKTLISGPYWMESDDKNRIIFNEQTANNIAVMDPQSQSLVEYHVPSKNPNWRDCDPGTGIMLDDCGVAQILDFTVDGEKIWFTEWVENNIGVVDTSVPLPVEIELESDELALTAGNSQHFNFIVYPLSENNLDVTLILSSPNEFITIELDHDSTHAFELDSEAPSPVHANIIASDDAISGTYKILVGAQLSDVAVSKYVTVTIDGIMTIGDAMTIDDIIPSLIESDTSEIEE